MQYLFSKFLITAMQQKNDLSSFIMKLIKLSNNAKVAIFLLSQFIFQTLYYTKKIGFKYLLGNMILCGFPI